jgi:hypothetical protein
MRKRVRIGRRPKGVASDFIDMPHEMSSVYDEELKKLP